MDTTHYLMRKGTTPCHLDSQTDSFFWTRIRAKVTCAQCKNALSDRS